MSGNDRLHQQPTENESEESQPFTLQDDAIYTPLAQEGCIVWMNVRQPRADETFILATAVSDETEPRASQLLKNEFALRPYLDSRWAVKPIASAQYHGRYALVYPAFPFKPLSRTGNPASSRCCRLAGAGDTALCTAAPDAPTSPDPR